MLLLLLAPLLCPSTNPQLSLQFTAKQLEKLAKKAEKDSKAEQVKVKKVGGRLSQSHNAGNLHAALSSWRPCLLSCPTSYVLLMDGGKGAVFSLALSMF